MCFKHWEPVNLWRKIKTSESLQLLIATIISYKVVSLGVFQLWTSVCWPLKIHIINVDVSSLLLQQQSDYKAAVHQPATGGSKRLSFISYRLEVGCFYTDDPELRVRKKKINSERQTSQQSLKSDKLIFNILLRLLTENTIRVQCLRLLHFNIFNILRRQ